MFVLPLLAACSLNDDYAPENMRHANVTASIAEYECDDATRAVVSYTTGFVYQWEVGDKMGIFPEGGRNHVPLNMYGDCHFTGNGFSVNKGTLYGVFYPDIKDYDLKYNAIELNYGTLTQNGNGSCSHITENDYLAATSVATDDHNVHFSMNHLGTILIVNATMPKVDGFTKLTIKSEDENAFTTKANLSLFAGSGKKPLMTQVSGSDEIILNLQNVSTSNDNETLTLFIQTAPFDQSGKQLVFTFKAQMGNDVAYTFTPKKAYVAGKAYKITLTSAL